MLEQLRRRKWNWFGYTSRRCDDSIVSQVDYYTVDTASKRATQVYLRRGCREEMWTAGFRYSYRKMEMQ